jgi:hypothetical protein
MVVAAVRLELEEGEEEVMVAGALEVAEVVLCR